MVDQSPEPAGAESWLVTLGHDCRHDTGQAERDSRETFPSAGSTERLHLNLRQETSRRSEVTSPAAAESHLLEL